MDGSNKAQALEESRAGNDPRHPGPILYKQISLLQDGDGACMKRGQPPPPHHHPIIHLLVQIVPSFSTRPPHNVDCDPDTTPTKPNTASSIPIPIPFSSSEEVMMMDYFMSPRSRASSTASTASSAFGGGSGNGSSGVSASAVAPRLRRRRSSLSIAAIMALAPSKVRNEMPVCVAAHGSIDVGPIGLSRGFGNGVGAMRGTASRLSSRTLGYSVLLDVLAVGVWVVHCDAFAVPRRPLVSRAHTVENVTTPGEATSSFLAPAPPLPSLPLDLRNNLKASISTGTPPSPNPLAELAAFWAPGARMNEN
ncbi:hypothetical protein B0F90DRAFT_1672205 [Multifurca ochricompacta]|uniref:Uncharacterized protein n=1 Tax=Multifurca ochricompacta TaxID=376703 RepID=A0AAD4QIS4_9AGAM|nr:hypothetical protein B0F90DRAFT_1672205 [Multifurca ochricompacta]